MLAVVNIYFPFSVLVTLVDSIEELNVMKVLYFSCRVVM